MSQNDVKIFDEYHTVARDQVMSLEECNKQFSTNFPITNRSKLAWQDYSSDYESLKMSENCIEGEWLTTHMSSLMQYLKKHDAIQQKKRHFVVDTHSGVTDLQALPVPEKVKIPVEDLEVEANSLKMEKIKLEDAFTTPADEVEAEINKNKSYGKNFVTALENYRSEKKIDWTNHLAFIPTEKSLLDKVINEELLLKHVFPDKNSVVETAMLWKKTLHVKNSLYNASDLFIVNSHNEKTKISDIPYIFKELENYETCKGTDMYTVRLIGERHL